MLSANLTEQLHEAIENDNINQVEKLLKEDVNLLKKDYLGHSALMNAKSPQMFNLIIEAAKTKDCLRELLWMSNGLYQNIFIAFLSDKKLNLLKILLTDPKCKSYAPDIYASPFFLDMARRASFNAKTQEEFLQLNKICSLIKKLPSYYSTSITKKLHSDSYRECYYNLFGSILADANDKSKPTVLKEIHTRIYELFKNPIRCLPYFDLLDKELKEYYETTYQTPFPTMSKIQHKYRSIDGVLYPIPTVNKKEDFIGLGKKHNILEQYLILFFKQYDLAEHSVQWIGFIPHNIANHMVRRGDFIKEDKYGIGLLHGRVIHKIQEYLIIRFLESGIDLSYLDENGILCVLTKKEILASFVEITDKDDDAMWSAARDRRDSATITIHDPHQFFGFLMRDKKQLEGFNTDSYEWNALTDCLIDSFCKNYLDWLHAFNTMHDVDFNVNSKTFAEYLDDLVIRFFQLENFTNYAIEKSKKRPITPDTILQDDYAVAAKHYKIDNPHFMFKPYIGDLFTAIMNKGEKHIQEILKGDDPNQVISIFSDIKHTPLTLAAKMGNLACFMELVKHPNINLNTQDSEGKTALYHALFIDGRYHRKMVEYLLAQPSVDPSIGLFSTQASPLNIAIQYNRDFFDQMIEKQNGTHVNSEFFALTQTLLDKIPDKNRGSFLAIITQNGTLPRPDKIPHFTLLQHAIICNEVNIVKKLLQCGASTKVNENGLDVLVLAQLFQLYQCQDIIDLLSAHQEKNNSMGIFRC